MRAVKFKASYQEFPDFTEMKKKKKKIPVTNKYYTWIFVLLAYQLLYVLFNAGIMNYLVLEINDWNRIKLGGGEKEIQGLSHGLGWKVLQVVKENNVFMIWVLYFHVKTSFFQELDCFGWTNFVEEFF